MRKIAITALLNTVKTHRILCNVFIDDDDEVARAMAIRFEEKGGVYYNNDDKINNEKVAVTDIAQYVAERTLSQYEEEFEV